MKDYYITEDQINFTQVPQDIFHKHISSKIPLAVTPLSLNDDFINHPTLKILPLDLKGFMSQDLLGFSYENTLLGFINNT